MKTKISLSVLFIAILFFSCKGGNNTGNVAIAEENSNSLENIHGNTNPILVISGTIINYKSGEGTITENSFWTGEKTKLGTIDKNGNFNIPLDQDFFNTVKKRMAEEEKDVPKGGEIRYPRVNTIFTCGSEGFGYKNLTEKINDSIEVIRYPRYHENNQATFKKGETITLKLPLLNVTDQKRNSHSILYAASTPELVEWLHNSGMGNIKKGYYLDWMFVENNSNVKGECVIPTGTFNGEDFTSTTITDLELKKGWNIIKYDITEVFTSTDGETKAAMTKISAITELPKDIKWFALASK